jgi:hypothetical protein
MYLGALPAVTNRSTYKEQIEVSDVDTGELVDLTDATIAFEIRDQLSQEAVLSATLAGGIAVISTGIFEVTFTSAQMRGLQAGTYDVGCVVSRDDDEQLIAGTLPVLDGVIA